MRAFDRRAIVRFALTVLLLMAASVPAPTCDRVTWVSVLQPIREFRQHRVTRRELPVEVPELHARVLEEEQARQPIERRKQVDTYATVIAEIARAKGRSPSLAVALIDRKATVHRYVRENGQEDYFSDSGHRVENRNLWQTNFIPDVRAFKLDSSPGRGANGFLTSFASQRSSFLHFRC